MKKLEQLQSEANKTYKTYEIMPMFIFGITLMCFNIARINKFILLIWFPFIYFAFIYPVAIGIIGPRKKAKAREQFRKLYKEFFVVNVLSDCFKDFSYKWKSGFPQAQVKQFGLVQSGNQYHSEDYLRGVYNDISFEQADVTILDTSGSGYNKTTLFRGRMLTFDFPEIVATGLQIHTKNFLDAEPSPSGHTMTEFQSENQKFNEIFKIKAADADDLNLLTPTFMLRLLELKERYNTIIIYFEDHKMYLGIHDGFDAFEPLLTGQLGYYSEQKRVLTDAQVIMDVINTMTLTSVMY